MTRYTFGALALCFTFTGATAFATSANPLLGSWQKTSGNGGCTDSMTFTADNVSRVWEGAKASSHVVYYVEGNEVYVQEHAGSGGTYAFFVISPNEIINSNPKGSCHWKRK